MKPMNSGKLPSASPARTPLLNWVLALTAVALLAAVWLMLAPVVPAPVSAPVPAIAADEPLRLRPPETLMPEPAQTATPAPETAAVMPEQVHDPALFMGGFHGVALSAGAGREAHIVVEPTALLLDRGLQLQHAEARIVGLGIEPVAVTVNQPYVGAPVALDVIAALKQLGGGSVEPLVGGVPLFLEVVAIDSAGAKHLSRVAFEVTTRDLEADERNLGIGLPPAQTR
jgi:hypothetical protein